MRKNLMNLSTQTGNTHGDQKKVPAQIFNTQEQTQQTASNTTAHTKSETPLGVLLENSDRWPPAHPYRYKFRNDENSTNSSVTQTSISQRINAPYQQGNNSQTGQPTVQQQQQSNSVSWHTPKNSSEQEFEQFNSPPGELNKNAAVYIPALKAPPSIAIKPQPLPARQAPKTEQQIESSKQGSICSKALSSRGQLSHSQRVLRSPTGHLAIPAEHWLDLSFKNTFPTMRHQLDQKIHLGNFLQDPVLRYHALKLNRYAFYKARTALCSQEKKSHALKLQSTRISEQEPIIIQLPHEYLISLNKFWSKYMATIAECATLKKAHDGTIELTIATQMKDRKLNHVKVLFITTLQGALTASDHLLYKNLMAVQGKITILALGF